MAITAKDNGKTFDPCPVGAHSAVCCDVQDLGDVEVTFNGHTSKKHMVRLVWQVNEQMTDGRPFVVGQRYNLTLNEKGNLRRDLQAWRGKPFTEEQLKDGFDLEVLIGKCCLVNVIHAPKDGRVYANVTSIMPLPKGMAPLTVSPDYIRKKDREPEPPKAAPEVLPDVEDVFVGAPPDDDYVPF